MCYSLPQLLFCCCDKTLCKSNFRKCGFFLGGGDSSITAGRDRTRGWKVAWHIISTIKKQRGRNIYAQLISLLPTPFPVFLYSLGQPRLGTPTMREGGWLPSSINLIKIILQRRALTVISQVVLDLIKLWLTIMKPKPKYDTNILESIPMLINGWVISKLPCRTIPGN